MITTRPRGTADILPEEAGRWRFVEDTFRRICREYNYREIRTPVFEHTELFERGVGDTTDIVEKEMYTFRDRGDRSVSLRPEGTAPVVRAYLESNLHSGPQPVKLYYTGAMFRYDKPQAGRYRQFHQLGVEALGSSHPALDAEMIAMIMDFYGRLGLKGLELHINSVGCPRCRLALKDELQNYLRPHAGELCINCKNRLERNPLRVLDCKEKNCDRIAVNAPTTLDCLCPDCGDHFDAVKEYLDRLGVVYQVDGRLVRGLDYYTHTAFEVMSTDIGSQSSIGGGGRYNGLVEACGGPPAPGVGFALGIERILLAMKGRGAYFPAGDRPDVFVVSADAECEKDAFDLLFALRKCGLGADMDYMGRSLKAQMKFAGKTGCRFVVILGGDELKRGSASVKDMTNGSQIELPLKGLAEEIKKLIGGN
ncbi:MAG: histidyl-tRNA synthetase [Peptococcaceae bacterium BRH_c4a]|nr:MAG: histidyl-tRNA synthetase [Peptococcaceae bacterium BRH_c4a]